jgi:hypothetical protein
LGFFKHILITRFNLSKRWKVDRAENSVLNKEWLDHRYQLFESFCFPSIKSQTCQNFEWWVYFDENLDTQYKIKNKELSEDFQNFIPKYENSYNDFEINMPKDLQIKLIKEGINWLITTRLDNDDVFAKDTVEIIQANASYNNLSLLEIPFGYTLEIKKISILRKVESYLNPFISLVEKVSNDSEIKSVYFQEHNKWKDIKKKIISKETQWIQIIHDRNVINRPAGVEVSSYGIKKRFNFKKLKFRPLYVFYLRDVKCFFIKISKFFKSRLSK